MTWPRWRRVIVGAVGVVLIVLGFLDVHVWLASIVVGLVLLGLVTTEQVVELANLKRRKEPDAPTG